MCKRNARQTPEGPPVRCHTGLPNQFLYTLRFDALPSAFRVAGFGRADLTLFPEMSPVTCEGETTVMLADCKRVYFLSDIAIRIVHNAVIANASHTRRLMAFLAAEPRAPIQAHPLNL